MAGSIYIALACRFLCVAVKYCKSISSCYLGLLREFYDFVRWLPRRLEQPERIWNMVKPTFNNLTKISGAVTLQLA